MGMDGTKQVWLACYSEYIFRRTELGVEKHLGDFSFEVDPFHCFETSNGTDAAPIDDLWQFAGQSSDENCFSEMQ